MTKDELKNLLTVAGWTCRTKGEEVVLQVCYFCGNDRWNLELNAAGGMFSCWVCKRGGRLSEAIKLLTGEDHYIPVSKQREKRTKAQVQHATGFENRSVAQVPSAMIYLAKRGLPAEVADRYGVCVCTQKGHRLEGRISFPLREFWTDEIVGWAGRSYTGQQPKYLSTLEQKVITGWRQRDRDTPAVVVEGPFDGLTAHRAGYHSAVLSGIGSVGIVSWAARLPLLTPVVIMLDPEAAQQAKQIYWAMQPVLGQRVIMVDYKGSDQDPAQLGPDGIRALVDDSLRGRGHH